MGASPLPPQFKPDQRHHLDRRWSADHTGGGHAVLFIVTPLVALAAAIAGVTFP